jgi:dTDP-4-dehydrorhamnose 3,5-epimerase
MHAPEAKLPKTIQHTELRFPFSDTQNAVLPSGVKLVPLIQHLDSRGFFMEVARCSRLKEWDFIPQQFSLSETAPGITKAFHYHQRQSDLFCPVSGQFRIVLLDTRQGESTCGHGYSIYFKQGQPFLLHIPPGVAHGYRILGETPGTMLYIMNREYDPKDELRSDWDDPRIAFPW